ncbi:hypothetical protein D3C71_1994690 [compost metagenome]
MTRSGILRASVFGMVEALETSALSGGVVRLENGSDLSSVLCCGSREASFSSFARLSLRYGRRAVRSLLLCEIR